jgi:competence protein ComFC
MVIHQKLKTLGSFIADLVFPIYCLSCSMEGTFLCENCSIKLPRVENQLCIACQKPSPFGKTHTECASRNKIDGIISALPYSDPKIAKIIETFKYQFISDLAPKLSQILVNQIKDSNLGGYFSDFTIVPVPLHRRRLGWRGFNQAELIAQALAADLKIPIATELVKRSRFTVPQTKLKREQRAENIRDAFETTGNSTQQKYLLVDDVITTGSTLNEIARILKKSGSPEVWAVTVAHG